MTMIASVDVSTDHAARIGWDDAAPGWDRHSALIRAWLHEPTERMLDAAKIASGMRVLDVAAGAGDQTLDVARRVGETGHVLASDISARFLALARANAARAGFANVTTHCANAESLALAPAQFDAAVCRMGLMFCERPLDALRGIRTTLKRGAHFSALVFSEPANNPCLTATFVIARKHAGLAPLSDDAFYTPGTLMSLGKPGLLCELLHKAGFIDIEIETLSAPFPAPSVDDYIEFLRASASPLIALLAPLPEASRTRAWSAMRDALDQFSRVEDWQGPNELLLCNARAR